MQINAEVIDLILAGKVTVQEALEVTPGVVELIAVMGAQFYEQGCYADAKVLFEGAVALDAKNYLGHAGLGVLALTEDKTDEALAHLAKAYESNSKDPAVCGNLGEAHLRLGNETEAVRYLRESAALDPQQGNPFANRARGILAAIQ